MIRFLIDEDMPKSTAKLLREAGFESFDVRDIGLRGAKDDVIYHHAQEENCIIITGDLGFANSLRYPLGSHPGILIARFPNEMSPDKINRILIDAIKGVQKDLPGNLIIIEPDKIRIRRQ
jgi:predicted nuclease of predicted toxin-antitoxin system